MPCDTASDPTWPWAYTCSNCGATMAVSAERLKCDCGGLLNLSRTLPGATSPDSMPELPTSRYRYQDQLPCRPEDLLQVSLGADMGTALLPHRNHADTWLKCDQTLPTGSFKDRGAALLAAIALQHGVERMVVDSSGNAGVAIAAHAARAGIPCDVFVPETTSPGKVRQAQALGANVHLVPGPRAEAEKAALRAADSAGSFYASHSLNPHFHHGVKTWIFEVCDQLGRAPGSVVLPVGSGSLLLGVALGLDDLLRQGRIKVFPRIIAVQSQACQTLIDKEDQPVGDGLQRKPVAEGIAVHNPARLAQMRATLERMQGGVVIVSDDQVLAAQKELGEEGFYVEPTGAVAWAGYKTLAEQLPGPVVVALTGSGMKTSPTV